MEENKSIFQKEISNLPEGAIFFLLSDISYHSLLELIKSENELMREFKGFRLEHLSRPEIVRRIYKNFSKNIKIRNSLLEVWQKESQRESNEIERLSLKEIESNFNQFLSRWGKEKFYLLLTFQSHPEKRRLAGKIKLDFPASEKKDFSHKSLTEGRKLTDFSSEFPEKIKTILRNKDREIAFLNKKIETLHRIIREKNKEIGELRSERENLLRKNHETFLQEKGEQVKKLEGVTHRVKEENQKLVLEIKAKNSKIRELELKLKQSNDLLKAAQAKSFNLSEEWIKWLKKEQERQMELLKKEKGGEKLSLVGRLEKLVSLEKLSLEILQPSGVKEREPSLPQRVEKKVLPEEVSSKYKQVISTIIFDINGGIIKTGEGIITLSHQELRRTGTKVGDTVLITYNPAKYDEWGRWVGKIIRKATLEETKALSEVTQRETKGLSLEELAKEIGVVYIPEKELIKILDQKRIKYTLIQDRFVFEQEIGKIFPALLEEVEVFGVCEEKECAEYCRAEGLFYKKLPSGGHCDVCGRFVGDVIDKIVHRPELDSLKQKIVLIGAPEKLKYRYISECKKFNVDIWWHDGVHEVHRLDGIIKNSNGVVFVTREKLQNTQKRVENACRRTQKKLVLTKKAGFGKIKKIIDENFLEKNKE